MSATMTTYAKGCISTVIPSLRYRDALRAIDWLGRAFGFQKKAVYMGPNNTVAHAELSFGNGMVMLGSVDNGSEFGKYSIQPDEVGGRQTKGIYLVVADADAVYTTAKAEGAEIVRDIADTGYGSREFSCRDLEGHLWSIGSYDPWQNSSSS